MTIRRITQDEVHEMLARSAAEFGYTIEQVDALWADEWTRYHELDPELQDTWLIWRAALGEVRSWEDYA